MLTVEQKLFGKARGAFAECVTLEEIPSEIVARWGYIWEQHSNQGKARIGAIAIVTHFKIDWSKDNREKSDYIDKIETMITDAERTWPKRGVRIVESEEPGSGRKLEGYITERDLFAVRKMIKFLGEREIPTEITDFIDTYEGNSSSPERK